MARTIEFDYTEAIDKATRLFWKNGYAKTSLRDLLKVMRIGEGSFYNTLKSKKLLYLECLKRYTDTVGARRRDALLAAPTAKRGIRDFFQVVMEDLDDPKMPCACLMGRSVSSEVLADRELRKFVQGQMASFADQVAKRLAADQKTGQFSHEFDPNVVAQIIVTYLQGLFRTALISFNRTKLERQTCVFLTGLGL